MKTEKFDVVIVGTGTAGETAAHALNQAGKSVAIIDCRPFGGTCALRGCQPKKYLVINTHLAADTRALLGKGFQQAAVTHWPDLQAFKREFTDPIPENLAQSLREAGITTYTDTAAFHSPHALRLKTSEELITAEHFIIATGSRPREILVDGAQFCSTSDDFLDLTELPNEMVFIGGGYISLEFAFIAALAGSRVTILQRGARILKQFPQGLTALIQKSAEEQGIRIVTGVGIENIEQQGTRYSVVTREHGRFSGDFIMNASGRVPNLEDLELARGNIQFTPRGIKTDDTMITSNPRVSAIGDCVASPQLSPVADMESQVAVHNILNPGVERIDYSAIPSVVFTHPQLASVGLTVEESREREEAVTIKTGRGDGWANYRRINASPVYYETVTDKATGRILGAHLVGPYAGEQINLFALAIKQGITAEGFKRLPWAYPTYTSDVKYMVD